MGTSFQTILCPKPAGPAVAGLPAGFGHKNAQSLEKHIENAFLPKWKNVFFSTPLVEVGQNRGFPRQRRKKCKVFCYLALFPEKSQGFTSGLWAQKLLAPFCNFDWKNSASGQAETSENESASSDKSWLESFFRQVGDQSTSCLQAFGPVFGSKSHPNC